MNFKDVRDKILANPEISREEGMKMIMEARAYEGEEAVGDVEVLQPELISFDAEKNILVLKVPVFRWQTNGNYDVQGGMLTYMIDCAFGIMGFVISGYGHVTSIDLETNFLRPVNKDDSYVTIVAEAVTNGRRMIHAKAQLLKTNGKVAVTASTNIMKLS